MAQPLKTIKNRIRSIENTKKVTGAMEMVAGAKLNRINKMLFSLRPYHSKLETILNNFLSSVEPGANPFLKENTESGKICLCVITSDSGLCGAYNNNIIRLAEEFINRRGRERFALVLIGKKGFNYFKNRLGLEAIKSYIGLNGRYCDPVADEISDFLINTFLSQKADQVYLAFTHFQAALIHKPVITKLLNIVKYAGRKSEYILEPDKERILEELIPRYLLIKLRLILMEAFTSEHAARTVAMKTATDNAKDLLQILNLLRNKVRQANITQDMMEIISSAEALKG